MAARLGLVIGIVMLFLWVGGVYWLVKKLRKNWRTIQDTVKKTGQVQQDQPSSPPMLRQVEVNSTRIVTETLDESLAKHRKKVEQELARLFKQQVQP